MIHITLQKNTGKTSLKNGGYTLLFAVLVSSLVLAIGISILTINKKEFLLTASARDSSAAFYSADGGLECAIQADTPGDNGNAFQTGGTDQDQTANLALSCPGAHITWTSIEPSFAVGNNPEENAVYFKFGVQFGPPTYNGPCANVVVTKTYLDGNPKTYIDSRGYNLGWNTLVNPPTCSLLNSKKVERAIEYSY